jgi:hypothetical protein
MMPRFIDEEIVGKNAYILDLIFVNILDTIFKQSVIEPALADIQACLHHELRYTVLPSNIEELRNRTQLIQRAFKLVNAHINNKLEKRSFAELVNIYHGDDSQEDFRKTNNIEMKRAIRRYISRVFSSTSGNVQGYLMEV